VNPTEFQVQFQPHQFQQEAPLWWTLLHLLRNRMSLTFHHEPLQCDHNWDHESVFICIKLHANTGKEATESQPSSLNAHDICAPLFCRTNATSSAPTKSLIPKFRNTDTVKSSPIKKMFLRAESTQLGWVIRSECKAGVACRKCRGGRGSTIAEKGEFRPIQGNALAWDPRWTV